MKIDGIDVLNAAVDDVLEITQEDADKGVPRDHHKCSIAVSWRRHQPDLEDVYVGKSRAYKLKDHFGYMKWFRYNISKPILIQEAILDNGGRFCPGTYILKAPRLDQGTGIQEGSDKDPNKPRPKPEPTLVKAPRIKTPMRENAPTAST